MYPKAPRAKILDGTDNIEKAVYQSAPNKKKAVNHPNLLPAIPHSKSPLRSPFLHLDPRKPSAMNTTKKPMKTGRITLRFGLRVLAAKTT
jgi:hypothetical protein